MSFWDVLWIFEILWILVGVLADRLDYKDYNIAKLDQYVQKSRSFKSDSIF